jgi:hypothetical protein
MKKAHLIVANFSITEISAIRGRLSEAGCSVLRALRDDELTATSPTAAFFLVTPGGTDLGAGTT